MPKGIIRKYPGGLSVLYGGTRTGIKLDRPWQLPIQVNPAKCPFCKGEGKVLKTFENRYFHLENLFTPHSYHTMVIPPDHWTEDQLRILGGGEEILKAFENILSLLQEGEEELWVCAYVGSLAGQNVTHMHYHVLTPERANYNYEDGDFDKSADLRGIEDREKELLECFRNSKRIFLRAGGLVVAIESIFRAGQCFIVNANEDDHRDASPLHLAAVLAKTVGAYAKCFRSKQGLAPDFQIFFKFLGRRLVYGSYLPILNHQGTTETVGAIHSGGPFIHPWMPEETLEALQKVS